MDMKSKEYLFTELAKIKKSFPDFSPYYEYDNGSNTFFIHVIPESIDNEQVFNEYCGMLIVDMMSKYPNEYLCFITSHSLTKLKNPQQVFKDTFLYSPIHFKEAKQPNMVTLKHLAPIFSGFIFSR